MAQAERPTIYRSVRTERGKFFATIRRFAEVEMPVGARKLFSEALEVNLGALARVSIGEAAFTTELTPERTHGLTERMFSRMQRAGIRLTNPVIGDLGGVDHLIAGRDLPFLADEPAKAMHAAGLINPLQGKVTELGASAGADPLGEVRVAALIYPDPLAAKKRVRRRSADRVVVSRPEGLSTEAAGNHRGILSHAWYSREGAEANRDNHIYGVIEGGNGTDVLAAIRKAAEEIGIRNYAMAITVEGEDLIVNGAVLSQLSHKPIETMEDLVAIQAREQLNGGKVDAVGTVFAARTDTEFKAMQVRSNIEPTGYTSHFHSDTGGHIVKIVPGEKSRTYFVLAPVSTAVDLQPL